MFTAISIPMIFVAVGGIFILLYLLKPEKRDKKTKTQLPEGLTRQYRGTFKGLISGPHYRYFCSCGTELTEGPSGGLSINAVCEKCRINYGCLPGYYGDQP